MTQISGPGAAPATMTGGPVEEHAEPQVIGPDTFKVVAGIEGDPDENLGVIFEGTDEQAATDAFTAADPGVGFVQLLRNGDVVDAKRAAATYQVVRCSAGDPADFDEETLYEGGDIDAANLAFQGAVLQSGQMVKILEDSVVQIQRSPLIVDAKPAPEPRPGEQASAFDAKPFVGPRPQVNDEPVDKIKIAFTGTWELDPMVAEDVAFWNRLAFGQSLDLRVEAEIVDIAGKYHRNQETDEETIAGVAKAKVLHVRRLTPEEL